MKLKILIPLLGAAGMVKGQGGANFIALGKNLANSSATFCMANSPAVVENTKNNIGFYGSNRFTGTDIVNGGIAASAKLKNTCLGINLGYSGTAKYNRRAAEIALGQKISDKLTLGFGVGYTQVQQGLDYGAIGKITGKIAAQIVLNSKIDAGLVITSPWLSNDLWIGAVPQIHFSTGYRVNEHTKVWAQYKQEKGYSSVYGIAFKHSLKKIDFLASLQTGNEPISIGFCYSNSNLQFSFGTAYHTYLGLTPGFSILWQLK